MFALDDPVLRASICPPGYHGAFTYCPAETKTQVLVIAGKPRIGEACANVLFPRREWRSTAFAYLRVYPSPDFSDHLRALFRNAPPRVYLLTDLDAFGMATYGVVAGFAKRARVKLRWLGINSAIITAARSVPALRSDLERTIFRIPKAETRSATRLLDAHPALARAIGEPAMEIIRSGHAIHWDGMISFDILRTLKTRRLLPE